MASFTRRSCTEAKRYSLCDCRRIGSSNVSHIAAETAVSSFLSDYYSTSDAWSTQTSAARVIRATNSWLYAQTQQSQGRFDKDRGYVCLIRTYFKAASGAYSSRR